MAERRRVVVHVRLFVGVFSQQKLSVLEFPEDVPVLMWANAEVQVGTTDLFLVAQHLRLSLLTLAAITAVSVQACEAPPPPVENSIMCRS